MKKSVILAIILIFIASCKNEIIVDNRNTAAAQATRSAPAKVYVAAADQGIENYPQHEKFTLDFNGKSPIEKNGERPTLHHQIQRPDKFNNAQKTWQRNL